MKNHSADTTLKFTFPNTIIDDLANASLDTFLNSTIHFYIVHISIQLMLGIVNKNAVFHLNLIVMMWKILCEKLLIMQNLIFKFRHHLTKMTHEFSSVSDDKSSNKISGDTKRYWTFFCCNWGAFFPLKRQLMASKTFRWPDHVAPSQSHVVIPKEECIIRNSLIWCFPFALYTKNNGCNV